MKKENPRFNPSGDVFCEDCPFADDIGRAVGNLCAEYGDDCPTEGTYAGCCIAAEGAA